MMYRFSTVEPIELSVFSIKKKEIAAPFFCSSHSEHNTVGFQFYSINISPGVSVFSTNRKLSV